MPTEAVGIFSPPTLSPLLSVLRAATLECEQSRRDVSQGWEGVVGKVNAIPLAMVSVGGCDK